MMRYSNESLPPMRSEPQQSVVWAFFLIAAYVATIPLANWLIQHVGTVCVPNGPCLIPIAPGVMAPSGVIVIGFALVLRDLIQRSYGIGVSLLCIVAGAILSAFIAPPALVLASALAFLISELADFAVYTPLARRRLVLAVLASGVVGAFVDSAVFLWMAFGSLDHLGGQVLGKLYATVIVAVWLYVRRTGAEAKGLRQGRQEADRGRSW